MVIKSLKQLPSSEAAEIAQAAVFAAPFKLFLLNTFEP